MAVSKSSTTTHPPDYLVMVATGLLVILGLQVVWSATFGISLAEYGDVNYYVARQGLWALIGGVVMVALARLDYRRWRRWSIVILVLAVAALAAVQMPGWGVTVYGAKRWLKLPWPLPPVQPSEFVKLALIIYLSAWLSSGESRLRSLRGGVVPFVLLVSLVGGLVMLQPDMGTTLVIALVAITTFFLSGAKVWHMILLGASGVGAFLVLAVFAGYRQERICSFLGTCDPDPGGRDFHIIQSLIALGSGGISGLGPGASRQKFFYLPDSHTDSIFAVLGEELGLVGTVGVILLITLLVYRCFRLARGAPDHFGALLAPSIGCWIAYQALINIGGITKSIPLTGITLPFISFGGSSLATFMAAVGLLLSLSRHRMDGPGEPLPKGREAPAEARSTPLPRTRGPTLQPGGP